MKTIRIGYAWQTLTSENLGVVALAESNFHIAKAAAKRCGAILSCIEFCPPGPSTVMAEIQGFEIADSLSLKKLLLRRTRYASQVASCDVILDIGAGDSFSDIYGMRHFYSLSLSKWLAVHSGVPLVMSPQTIGPFESVISRYMAHYLIKRANHVFVRDGLSMDYLRSASLDDNADEVIDVAFRLPFVRRGKTSDGRLHVGVNVSGLLYNGGYTKNNQFGLSLDYAALIEKLLAELCARSDVTVHLIAHVISNNFDVEDDYRVCKRLANRFPNIVLAPKFTTPSDAKSYISGLNFFTGARMHSCIAAYSSGVPVIPMAYSRKFNGLFASLGYMALCDLKVDDVESAFRKILNALNHRESLAIQIAKGNALAETKLQRYEDYLAKLFGSLCVRKH